MHRKVGAFFLIKYALQKFSSLRMNLTYCQSWPQVLNFEVGKASNMSQEGIF